MATEASVELVPIKELLRRRRRLVKGLKCNLIEEGLWTAAEEAMRKKMDEDEIAAIDAQIAERTGEAPAAEPE
jgi:hypothetical protein